MSNILVLECLFVVLFFVESNDSIHSNILEDAAVLAWMVTIFMSSITLLYRTHECHKLAWDDPVEISVFDFLIVLIFFDVETFEVVPSKSYGVL